MVLLPRPSPLSPYRDILRRTGKPHKIAKKTTFGYRGVQKPRQGLSEGMRKGLQTLIGSLYLPRTKSVVEESPPYMRMGRAQECILLPLMIVDPWPCYLTTP